MSFEAAHTQHAHDEEGHLSLQGRVRFWHPDQAILAGLVLCAEVSKLPGQLEVFNDTGC